MQNAVVLSTLHQDVSLESNAKKTPETIKFTIFLTKWPNSVQRECKRCLSIAGRYKSFGYLQEHEKKYQE